MNGVTRTLVVVLGGTLAATDAQAQPCATCRGRRPGRCTAVPGQQLVLRPLLAGALLEPGPARRQPRLRPPGAQRPRPRPDGLELPLRGGHRPPHTRRARPVAVPLPPPPGPGPHRLPGHRRRPHLRPGLPGCYTGAKQELDALVKCRGDPEVHGQPPTAAAPPTSRSWVHDPGLSLAPQPGREQLRPVDVRPLRVADSPPAGGRRFRAAARVRVPGPRRSAVLPPAAGVGRWISPAAGRTVRPAANHHSRARPP